MHQWKIKINTRNGFTDHKTKCLDTKKQEKSQQNGKYTAKMQFLVKMAAILDFGPAHFFPGPKAENFVIIHIEIGLQMEYKKTV